MITVLASGNPRDDYVTESLKDAGLRTFLDFREVSKGSPSASLLLVTKEDLSNSEIRVVENFLETRGDVIVLCPCPKLFKMVGNWDSVNGTSGLLPNDSLLVYSSSVPILEPIHSTEDGSILQRTTDLKLPVLVSRKVENTILFFSFSVSRNIFKIKQGCFDERYLTERKRLGGFAHIELNPLEKIGKKVQNIPCADLLSYFVLEKVLSMLRDKGIVLPFLWNLPDSKDASFLMTMDEDWAPPIVLKDALSLFRSNRVPVTLFITKPLDEHEELHQDGLIDISIHPHHKEDDFQEETLKEAISFLPQLPTGFRNHRRLVEKPDMYVSAERLGIQWESNLGVSNSIGYALGTGLPFRIIHDLRTFDILEFPIHFEDDVYFSTCGEIGFDGSPLIEMMEDSMESFHTVLVFGFHPIHVFLNSSSEEEYGKVKEEALLDDMESLMTFRKSLLKKRGTRTILERTLQFINSNRKRLALGTIEKINHFWRKRAETRIGPTDFGFEVSPIFKGLGIVLPFVDVRRVRDGLECSSMREVRVAEIPCTLIEPPPGAIKKRSWNLPNLGHAGPQAPQA